jgi:hypothetical protein
MIIRQTGEKNSYADETICKNKGETTVKQIPKSQLQLGESASAGRAGSRFRR